MAGEEPTDTPQVIKVADGLYVRQEVDNIAWIDMGTYALVVDALEQASLEREVLDAMELTIGRKPVRYVLNTHTHYDHTALNEAFRRHFGAEIVNQDTCGIPADGRWFEGRRRVWMFPAPGCHTDEDCCVWCPDDGALFVGDIFGWGLIPLTRPLRGDTVRLLEDGGPGARPDLFDGGAEAMGRVPALADRRGERGLRRRQERRGGARRGRPARRHARLVAVRQVEAYR
jgi:glyoxylase-like metal-dependent hydrolase (beta-lactamase superfamily II)